MGELIADCVDFANSRGKRWMWRGGTAGGARRYLAVQGGMVEVVQDHGRVLANLAECAEDIDGSRAHADLDSTRQDRQEMYAAASGESSHSALEAVALALARVAAVEGK